MPQRFKIIFLLASFLFVFHGMEEIITKLYAIDSHVKFMFGWLEPFISLQNSFIFFQLVVWALLFIAYFFLLSGRWAIIPAFIVGFVFVYEVHHFYKAVGVGGYYPGLWTALLFPILVFFYWRELLGILLKR